MKKSDIALIILIVGVSLAIAYFAGQYVMQNTGNKGVVKVETIEVLKPDFTKPSKNIFNQDAINPTVSVSVGGGNSSQPIGQ